MVPKLFSSIVVILIYGIQLRRKKVQLKKEKFSYKSKYIKDSAPFTFNYKPLSENITLKINSPNIENNPDDFETPGQQDSLEIVESEFFAISGYVRKVGRDVKFNGAAFSLAENEISSPTEGARGYYIIKLMEKQEFDEATFNLQKESLKADLLQKKQNTAYSNWFNDLKEKAKIEDFRYQFY